MTVPCRVHRTGLSRAPRRRFGAPRSLLPLLAWACSTLLAHPAAAEPATHELRRETPATVESASSRGELALITGLALGGVAFGAGAHLVSGQDDLAVKRAGLYVAHAGLALAPLVAHGVVGEWGRGALFSILPALGAVSMVTLLAVSPMAPVKSTHGDHRFYPIPIIVSVVGGAAGVFDAALVDERSRPSFGASVTGNSAAVTLGGVF